METILSVVALFFSTISGGFALYTFFWTSNRDRKQATLDAYNILQEQVFDKINLLMPKEIEEIAKNNRSKDYKELSGYIARIEHFCVGINTKIYDFNTVYELGHGYFDGSQLKKRICPIVDRKQTNSSHDYYANIHKVWNRMDKKTERNRKG